MHWPTEEHWRKPCPNRHWSKHDSPFSRSAIRTRQVETYLLPSPSLPCFHQGQTIWVQFSMVYAQQPGGFPILIMITIGWSVGTTMAMDKPVLVWLHFRRCASDVPWKSPTSRLVIDSSTCPSCSTSRKPGVSPEADHWVDVLYESLLAFAYQLARQKSTVRDVKAGAATRQLPQLVA